MIDDTLPVIENCFNQTLVLQAMCADEANRNNADCAIVWDQPTILDNSNSPLLVSTHLITQTNDSFMNQVVYTATDTSNNSETCVMNITLKYEECDFPEPENGDIVCMKNADNSVCLLFCRTGHAIFDWQTGLMLQNITLVCEHKYAKWQFDEIPDCGPITEPNVLKDVLDIQIDSDFIDCNSKSDMLPAVSV